jgi:hypothetical protein
MSPESLSKLLQNGNRVAETGVCVFLVLAVRVVALNLFIKATAKLSDGSCRRVYSFTCPASTEKVKIVSTIIRKLLLGRPCRTQVPHQPVHQRRNH